MSENGVLIPIAKLLFSEDFAKALIVLCQTANGKQIGLKFVNHIVGFGRTLTKPQ